MVEEDSVGPVQFVQSGEEEAQDQCSQAQKHLPWASLLEGEEPTCPREVAPSLPLRGSVSHPVQPPSCMTLSAWILSVVESSLLPKIVHPKG